MRISDWSSDVCSSDLLLPPGRIARSAPMAKTNYLIRVINKGREKDYFDFWRRNSTVNAEGEVLNADVVGFEVAQSGNDPDDAVASVRRKHRSEENTSELQSLMRISYAVVCLKKKKNTL